MLKKKLDNDLAGNKLGTLNESPEVKSSPLKFSSIPDPTIVRVSAYEDGVNCFYVRFKSKKEECRRFELRVNALADDLVPLRIVPNTAALNTFCLVQFNNRLHRGKIVQVEGKLTKNSVVVQFLETGVKMRIDVNKLFKIPDNIAAIPPFAKRYKLIHYEPKFTAEENEIAFYFEQITKTKTLSLRDSNDSGETPAIPSCDLLFEEQSIAQKMASFNPHSYRYPPQTPLGKNEVYDVSCSANKSLKQFYVQLSNIDPDLEKQYEQMQNDLRFQRPPTLFNPVIGDACIVKFQDLVYRGIITNQASRTVFVVRFVDYGNEEDFGMHEIKMMAESFMKLPPFAYRCCLKGFEGDKEVYFTTAADFIDICNHIKEFKMKVVDKSEHFDVVELEDPSTGSSIFKLLKDINKKINENSSNWTEQHSSFMTHFKHRAQMCLADETVHSLTESPEKSKRFLNWDDDPTSKITAILKINF